MYDNHVDTEMSRGDCYGGFLQYRPMQCSVKNSQEKKKRKINIYSVKTSIGTQFSIHDCKDYHTGYQEHGMSTMYTSSSAQDTKLESCG
jgi:hypothetical protein